MLGILKATIGILAALGFVCASWYVIDWEWEQKENLERTSEVENKKEADKKDTKKSAKAKQGTADNPIVVRLLPEETRKEEPNGGKEQHGRYSSEWNLVYATVALTGFTLGLMIYTALLWGESKETAKRQLRAYVGVVGQEIEARPSQPDPDVWDHVAFIDYANKGQTPAHDLTCWINQGVGPRAAPDTFFKKSDDEGKGGVMLPSAIWRRHVPIALHNLSMDSLEKEKDVIWVWGGINYTDSFGEKCEVQFRFWAVGKRSRPRQEGGIGSEYYWPMTNDKRGNKATYGNRTPS